MAKIKITESELKQVIRESVVGVLNEAKRWNNYGMNWDQLSDPEKKAYAEKYGMRAGAAYYTDANGNPVAGGYGGQNTAYDYDKLGEYYANQQKLKSGKANRNGFSADYVNTTMKGKDDEITKLNSQLDSANKTATMYRNAIGAVSKALNLSEGMIKESISPDIEGAPQPGVSSAQKQPVGQEGTPVGKAPELDAILGAIKRLNGTISTQKASITDLTTKLQQSNAQLAQARNQAVRSGAAQPAVNQNQAIPAAKSIPQQTTRPAAQAPGTAIAQK